MGQLEDLRLFVSVVENGSISRAAEDLYVAKSAVSRRLGQLEERYGARLIERQPRLWKVTAAGEELYQRATNLVTDADDLDADFKHAGYMLRGPLSITVAREFGLSYLRPTLFAFAKEHPEIDLTLDFDDRTVDLDSENYDLAVRITASHLSGLKRRRLGVMRHGLFASRSYAERVALPEDPKALSEHPLLHYGSAKRARWEYLLEGKKRSITFRPALNSNNGTFLVDAALEDLGIIHLPYFIVSDALRDGTLVPVLPALTFEEFGIYVVHSEKRRLNKRMRTLMDYLEARCASLADQYT
ncbi:MAG: LysR family transcriptional regulator [Pseudomonadota bacterium]